MFTHRGSEGADLLRHTVYSDVDCTLASTDFGQRLQSWFRCEAVYALFGMVSCEADLDAGTTTTPGHGTTMRAHKRIWGKCGCSTDSVCAASVNRAGSVWHRRCCDLCCADMLPPGLPPGFGRCSPFDPAVLATRLGAPTFISYSSQRSKAAAAAPLPPVCAPDTSDRVDGASLLRLLGCHGDWCDVGDITCASAYGHGFAAGVRHTAHAASDEAGGGDSPHADTAAGIADPVTECVLTRPAANAVTSVLQRWTSIAAFAFAVHRTPSLVDTDAQFGCNSCPHNRESVCPGYRALADTWLHFSRACARSAVLNAITAQRHWPVRIEDTVPAPTNSLGAWHDCVGTPGKGWARPARLIRDLIQQLMNVGVVTGTEQARTFGQGSIWTTPPTWWVVDVLPFQHVKEWTAAHGSFKRDYFHASNALTPALQRFEGKVYLRPFVLTGLIHAVYAGASMDNLLRCAGDCTTEAHQLKLRGLHQKVWHGCKCKNCTPPVDGTFFLRCCTACCDDGGGSATSDFTTPALFASITTKVRDAFSALNWLPPKVLELGGGGGADAGGGTAAADDVSSDDLPLATLVHKQAQASGAGDGKGRGGGGKGRGGGVSGKRKR